MGFYEVLWGKTFGKSFSPHPFLKLLKNGYWKMNIVWITPCLIVKFEKSGICHSFLFGSRGEERSYMKCILSPVAVTKICCLLSLRQILTAATPFCSLSRPQDALANVPLRPDLFLFLFDLFGCEYTGKMLIAYLDSSSVTRMARATFSHRRRLLYSHRT